MSRTAAVAFATTLLASSALLLADEHTLHTFRRVQLTSTYYSEGVSFGDINKDGQNDVVYGPYWFAGPDFQKKYEIYKPVPQPTEGYADNFFSWVHDFDGDGWHDVLVVGFPGTPAHVYQNPGRAVQGEHWPKHEVADGYRMLSWISLRGSPNWPATIRHNSCGSMSPRHCSRSP